MCKNSACYLDLPMRVFCFVCMYIQKISILRFHVHAKGGRCFELLNPGRLKG